MEQTHFKVKFPLGSKIVISLIVLLTLLVGVLSYLTVSLLIEDKRAYTYQLQLMEAYVASRDFSERIKFSLDNLKVYLTSFDPRQAVSEAQIAALENIAKSQFKSPAFYSFLIKENGESKKITQSINNGVASRMSFDPNIFHLDAELVRSLYPKLRQNTFILKNITHLTREPLTLIAYADLGLKDNPDGMPVAMTLVDANILSESKHFSEITIALPNGDLLYSSSPEVMRRQDKVFGRVLFQEALSNQTPSGTTEFVNENTRYLGAFQKTSLGPVVMAQIEWTKAMAAAFTLSERLVILGLISIIISILFAFWFSSTISKPLKQLFTATSAISSGDFNVNVQVKTTDEVGQLAHSFSVMSGKIQELIEETAKKAHLQEELKLAATVAESLFPKPEYRDNDIEILGHYQSATECGGDWWGFFRVESKVYVMIADATGHGVPAALVTSAARSCFSVLNRFARKQALHDLTPREILSYANQSVFDSAASKIMMTMFVGVIDIPNQTLTYSSAAHCPVWILKKEGKEYDLKSLVPEGVRLGEAEDATDFPEHEISFNPGDMIVMYTDGWIENRDPETGEEFGKKRARKLVTSSAHLGSRGLMDAIVKNYKAFNQGQALEDDVTLCVVQRLPVAVQPELAQNV